MNKKNGLKYKSNCKQITKIQRNPTSSSTRTKKLAGPDNQEKIFENENTFAQNTICSAINNFRLSLDEDITFTFYFRRFENLYDTVRLLLRKLGIAEHSKFGNYMLPSKTSELTFTEAVKLLSKHFTPKPLLFHKAGKWRNLTREYSEDYTTFASIVNKHCDDFKLSELSKNNLNYLMFV